MGMDRARRAPRGWRARTTAALAGMLLAAGAAVPARAACDTAGPVIGAVSIPQPLDLDTSAGPQSFSCGASITDDLSGVARFDCSLTLTILDLGGGAARFKTVACSAEAPTSGTRTDGTWNCLVEVPRYVSAGAFAIPATPALSAIDRVGNPSAPPLVSEFVGVSGTADLTGPVLGSFSLAPAAVDVSAGPADVTCTMPVADDLAGVGSATCTVQVAPLIARSCTATSPASGTRLAGTFSCTMTIPQYDHQGSFPVAVELEDLALNTASTSSAQLIAAGRPGILGVTSVPSDVAAPTLVSFDFTPKTVDVSAADRTVQCTIVGNDALSGAVAGLCAFNVDDGNLVSQSVACADPVPVAATPGEKTFSCTLTVPAFSAGGSWASSTVVFDQVGNSLIQAPAAGTLAVSCASAGPPPANLEFPAGTKSALQWGAIPGATGYRVYQRTVAATMTPGSGGQPAGGYGTCATAAALGGPNFDASATPAPGSMHTFLVASIVGGVESGIGSTSAGTLRTDYTTCTP